MKGGSTCGCINDFHGKMCISGCMDRSERQPINCFYAKNPPHNSSFQIGKCQGNTGKTLKKGRVGGSTNKLKVTAWNV